MFSIFWNDRLFYSFFLSWELDLVLRIRYQWLSSILYWGYEINDWARSCIEDPKSMIELDLVLRIRDQWLSSILYWGYEINDWARSFINLQINLFSIWCPVKFQLYSQCRDIYMCGDGKYLYLFTETFNVVRLIKGFITPLWYQVPKF